MNKILDTKCQNNLKANNQI